MSDLSPIRMSEARPLAGFRPWFGNPFDELGAPSSTATAVDQAYADGLAAGRRLAETTFDDERKSLRALLGSSEAFTAEPTDGLARMIAEAVEQIVQLTVGSSTIDAALLVARAQRAAKAIGDAEAPHTLFLHPDDEKLVADMEVGLTIAPDPKLTRGSLRIENASGSVEDGIATHLAALREQLGLDGDVQ